MHIIYKVTYLPHYINKTPPYFYMGSKYSYSGKYYGSPSSKQKDWYTGELSIREWWKKECAKNPQDFLFEIIETYLGITTKMLVENEFEFHKKYNVRNSIEYFNKSDATKGWVSSPRTEKTKEKVSEITKKYWNQETEEVSSRKKQLIEYNKKNSSEKITKLRKLYPEKFSMNETKKQKLSFIMKEKWKNGEFKKNKPRKERKIFAEGMIFESAKKASEYFNIHPVNIRRKCRSSKYQNWNYVGENNENSYSE